MNTPAAGVTETSRCKRLKAASSRDHDSVDQRVMAARPFEDRERYARFLLVQHRFHGSVLGLYHDEQLNQRLPGLNQLSRYAAVEQDLCDLDMALPQTPQAISVNPSKALGWLYCCEGSNLGAAFLFKQTQRLGLDEHQGARHLAAHPDGRALHWREFVAKLDGLSLSAEEEQEVIAGAIEAFDSYRAHLQAVFAD